MIYKELNIHTQKDINKTYDLIMHHLPEVGGFDTETTGLNIKYDNPFLFQFGFLTNNHKRIYTFTLDLELESQIIIQNTFIIFDVLLQTILTLLAHNITFDMHMLRNGKYPIKEIFYPKLMDTQALIRIANEAIPERDGGAPLKLKNYVNRYIDKTAKIHERKLKAAITANIHSLTIELLNNLKKYKMPEEYKIKGTERNWTMDIVKELTKDSITTTDNIPEPYKTILENYFKKLPYASRYDLLDRDMVVKYGHKDVVDLFLVYLKDYPHIIEIDSLKILQQECEIIPGIFALESAGRHIDLPYALEAKQKLKKYILQLRLELKELCQSDINVGQSKELIAIFNNLYNTPLKSTSKDILEETVFINPKAERLALIISTLRSATKWYTAYLVHWTEDALKYNDNYIYPQYNPEGAVTGRTSSPFQQFPRDPFTTLNGEVIFIPRKMFTAPEGQHLYYFDYSAMELRVQAIYTMLLNTPDLNLCRAFLPLQCTLTEKEWYLNEEPTKKWHPIDIHSATYAFAYNINIKDVTKEQRYIGKRTNFGIIYGIGPAKLAKMLNIPLKEAQALHNAFYHLYENVRFYERYVRNEIVIKGYAENLFGRRYIGASAHKCKNYLIQGTCADYTKKLLPEILLAIKGTSFILEGYLHDEYSFRGKEEDEALVLPKIKNIMEQLETQILMHADLERADTDWSEKYDYRILEKNN